MPGINHKSIGIDLKTYTKLKKMSEDEHRNIRQQIGFLVSNAYKEKYGDPIVPASGIASVGQKNTV